MNDAITKKPSFHAF